MEILKKGNMEHAWHYGKCTMCNTISRCLRNETKVSATCGPVEIGRWAECPVCGAPFIVYHDGWKKQAEIIKERNGD